MSWVSRIAVAFCSAALLAACNASLVQPSRGTVVALGTAPADKGQSLLYLSDVATNDVYVYSYPHGKLVGTLTGFGEPRSECADTAGDVWIADIQAEQLVEYAHGASKPMAALSTFGPPRGCSVDPTSGDLAVSGGVDGTVLSVYDRSKQGIWRDARRYGDSSIRAPRFCGYDGAGNLFIDGASKVKGGTFRLAELPKGAGAVVNLSVNQSISAPGQVQWDGKHVAVGDAGISPSVIYEFAISGRSATKVGATTLEDTTSVRQFWIQAQRLIGPDFDSDVRFWNYPAGGSPTKTIKTVHGFGAAVSLP
jgi:hypothetical protein